MDCVRYFSGVFEGLCGWEKGTAGVLYGVCPYFWRYDGVGWRVTTRFVFILHGTYGYYREVTFSKQIPTKSSSAVQFTASQACYGG